MFPQVTSLIHPKEYLAGLHELGCEEGRKQVPRTCSPSLNSHKWHVYSSCTIRPTFSILIVTGHFSY